MRVAYKVSCESTSALSGNNSVPRVFLQGPLSTLQAAAGPRTTFEALFWPLLATLRIFQYIVAASRDTVFDIPFSSLMASSIWSSCPSRCRICSSSRRDMARYPLPPRRPSMHTTRELSRQPTTTGNHQHIERRLSYSFRLRYLLYHLNAKTFHRGHIKLATSRNNDPLLKGIKTRH